MGKQDPDRLPKLRRQIRGFRDTKAATVPRAKYQNGESSTKKALEFCRTFPLSLLLNTDQHMDAGKLSETRDRTTRKEQGKQSPKFTQD